MTSSFETMQKTLKLYNALSEKKEVFRPLNSRVAKIYTCGPTVYNFAHIGNLRTYIFEDVMRKTIKLAGYKVLQVMNITDIDDKIIKSAISSRKKIEDITLPFEKYFWEDIKKLNIETPEKIPRATDHIQEMILIIKKLIKKEYAYIAQDGSLYFNIAKFKKYGKLSRSDMTNQQLFSRTIADEYEKNKIKDFALWKIKKEGEPSWSSPWGDGRPGWHIECSAMAMKYLGHTLDIHAGGVDNMFPHHENEIAQSEAYTGKLFSRFFIHGEHLLVNGKKMAKSAGNFYTIRDLEKKGYDPIAFRYLCLQTHYRSKMNFTWKSLDAASKALINLRNIVAVIKNNENTRRKQITAKKIIAPKNIIEKKFFSAIANDLNTPQALAILWDALKNKKINTKDKLSIALYADNVLGLNINHNINYQSENHIPLTIKSLAIKREALRNKGDFSSADKIRKTIEKKGYKIIDIKKGGYNVIKANE